MSAFAGLFVPAPLREAVSDRAWVDAMLAAEVALARAGAAVGAVPAGVPDAVEAAARPGALDPGRIAVEGRAAANPAEPLVRALREAVGPDAADYVHWGATSQDVVDTAAMLVARDALALVLAELDETAAACAALAERHRAAPAVARTLLQQAVPSTFGLKAAGWLDALLDARARLAAVRERLAAQLGGAAGTLAGFGERGPEALAAYAAGLGLAEPPLPWHAHRGRVAELAAALEQTAGTAAKIALDVILLAQSEVAEVAEAAGGASSTMPQKQNPAGSAIARACARLASANASLLTGGLEHEHERAAGAWQTEWPALTAALAYTGGAVAAVRGVLDGLRVDEERMRRNLDAAGGAVLAERLVFLLTPRVGREQALRSVRDALGSPAGLREALLADPAAGLGPDELDEALDPATATGAATALVDRALARHRGGGAR